MNDIDLSDNESDVTRLINRIANNVSDDAICQYDFFLRLLDNMEDVKSLALILPEKKAEVLDSIAVLHSQNMEVE